MNPRPRSHSLAASPLLVGTATTLITVVAVFLSYNANAGLPFVPTYDITARVPDAAGLIRGNEVRIGGKRAGIVRAIAAVKGPSGRPEAELQLKLDQEVAPLREDTRIRVRPRSPLGLKYLELVPGTRGAELPPAARLPVGAAGATVELDEVLNTFDASTRRAAQVTVEELGNALAGRGGDVNALLEDAPPLVTRIDRVASNLGDRRTDLAGFLRAADRTLSELALSAPRLGPLVSSADVTAGALDGAREELGQTIDELGPTESAGTRALAVARPVLADAAGLARDIRPGTALLPTASQRLHEAISAGTPVVRRATALAGRLEATLESVERLAEEPSTLLTLERLRDTLESADPTLRFLAPLQTRCNYLGLWTRNVNSTISEGDSAGTWFRTLVVGATDEFMPAAEPAPSLHVNQYPNIGAPGQEPECESGNEPYLPGRRIGNVPGNQGGSTEATRPPRGVAGP